MRSKALKTRSFWAGRMAWSTGRLSMPVRRNRQDRRGQRPAHLWGLLQFRLEGLGRCAFEVCDHTYHVTCLLRSARQNADIGH